MGVHAVELDEERSSGDFDLTKLACAGCACSVLAGPATEVWCSCQGTPACGWKAIPDAA